MSKDAELRKLAELKSDGVLTQNEFDIQKAALLAYMPPPITPGQPTPASAAASGSAHPDAANVAPFRDRFGAAFVDAFAAILFGFTAIGIGALVGRLFGGGRSDVGPAISIVLFLIAEGTLGIFQMYLLATTGQTWGKRVQGIRVEALNGDPPSFLRTALLRQGTFALLLTLPYVGMVFFFIDLYLLMKTDERRTLHDRAAGTIVRGHVEKQPLFGRSKTTPAK